MVEGVRLSVCGWGCAVGGVRLRVCGGRGRENESPVTRDIF